MRVPNRRFRSMLSIFILRIILHGNRLVSYYQSQLSLKICFKHFFFLRLYTTESFASTITNADEKIYRKWVAFFKLVALMDLVSS